MTHVRSGEHAIVVGASIAGLAQAAALCRHFAKVTILESDKIDPNKPASRTGVPQDRQVHGLLGRGRANLEMFLPGLHQQLVDSGVAVLEYGHDVCWHMMGTWWSEVPTGVRGIGFTRPHFEFHLRRRLLKEKNITLKSGAMVKRYLMDTGRTRVSGVEFQDSTKAEQQTLQADLVVDCTGRYSRTLRWLEQEGFGPIPTEEMELDVSYMTQLYRFTEPQPWNFLYLGSTPLENKRVGVLLRGQDDLYVLGLASYFGEIPPRDPEGIRAYLASLKPPVLADVFDRMVPVDQPSTYRFKSNLRRYYGRAKNLPEGLALAGDVACSFDPVFGQGMTAATLSAEVMDTCLKRAGGQLKGLTAKFHKAQDKVLNEPWMAALTNDLRYPETKGARPLPVRFMMAYTGLVLQAMHHPWVHDRVIHIFNMTKTGAHFFTPPLIWAAILVKLGIIRPRKEMPKKLRESLAKPVAAVEKQKAESAIKQDSAFH